MTPGMDYRCNVMPLAIQDLEQTIDLYRILLCKSRPQYMETYQEGTIDVASWQLNAVNKTLPRYR